MVDRSDGDRNRRRLVVPRQRREPGHALDHETDGWRAGRRRRLGLAPLEDLQRIQLRVDPGRPRQQLFVAPDLRDAAALQHDDGVGAPDGGQPVRDDERRAVAHQVLQRFLDQQLRFGVERRRRLVQDQDRRVLQQRARNRQALALPARQLLAALADAGLVLLRQRHDEIVRVRGARRRLDVVARRAGRSVRDVAGNRLVEQHRLLRHDADLRPQRRERHVADVRAVDEDAARGHVVEPRHQIHERRLARAAQADNRHRLAGPHRGTRRRGGCSSPLRRT